MANSRQKTAAKRAQIRKAASQARAAEKVTVNVQSTGSVPKWILNGKASGGNAGGGGKAGGRGKRGRRSNRRGALANYLDATHDSHLPLPRAVMPYSVVRLTKRINYGSGNAKLILVGAYVTDSSITGREGAWMNFAAVSNHTDFDAPMNQASNTYLATYPTAGIGDFATVAPHACTVQIMNPGALQTTTGIIYVGRSRTQLPMSGTSRKWSELADELIQFQSPVLLSAGRAALSRFKISAGPMNMAELANFRPLDSRNDGLTTWNGTTSGDFDPSGLSPIFIVKPAGMELELLITMEWKVRFSPDNVACTTHVHHKPGTESVWDRLVNGLEDAGVIEAGVRAASAALA